MTLELLRAVDHVRLHRGKTIVIKVGGACVARRRGAERVARQVAAVDALGARVVLVHGAGPQVSALQRERGEEPRLVDGRRVTTPVALAALSDAAERTRAMLTDALRAAGADAVASGAVAAGIARAVRRPPVETSAGVVDFGLVGDIAEVRPDAVDAELRAGRVPVIGPPVACSGDGDALNVNADVLAAELAVALGAEKLVLLTSAAGILADPNDAHSAIHAMDLAELAALREQGTAGGGMHVKSAAIERALTAGVERVHVVSGMDEDSLLVELYTGHGAGTLVLADSTALEAAP
jgi:acetylglutamate kinase